MKWITLMVLASTLATPLPAVKKISDYNVCFGYLPAAAGKEPAIALRQFRRGGDRFYLVVRGNTLATEILPAGTAAALQPMAFASLRREYAELPYFRAMTDAEANAQSLQDAGITHMLPAERGITLTIDLCPSHKPLDRSLFSQIILAFSDVEKPVPLAVSLSGRWLEEHEDDLHWLVGLVQKGDITIDWINHSYHHQYSRKLPLKKNFLLEKGVNLKKEILLTERRMLENGLTPSVFFRFPGLVSTAQSFLRVLVLGLIPVGSDAWLAKNQAPQNGSIVLIHGNGNEPLGIKRFLALIQAEKKEIKKKNWLLFDLRSGIAAEK